jgi:hypothetical protein
MWGGGWKSCPPACHLDDQGNPLPEKNEDWQVEEVTNDLVRLSAQSGHQLKLGTDHIYSFATNPQRMADCGFLTLHVQVFVQGDRVFVKPNSRPGERVSSNPAIIQDKIVGFNYPTESGIQQPLKLLAIGFLGPSNPNWLVELICTVGKWSSSRMQNGVPVSMQRPARRPNPAEKTRLTPTVIPRSCLRLERQQQP